MTTQQSQFLQRLCSWLCLGLMAGCCSIPATYQQVTKFQQKHPKEFGKYAYLNPVSLNSYLGIWGYRAGAASYILDETKRRFGKTEGVEEFVQKMAKREGEDRRQIVDFFRDLESASSGGGVVCQYEWSDGKTRETGFLVLKSGEVIKREPWITDYLTEQKE